MGQEIRRTRCVRVIFSIGVASKKHAVSGLCESGPPMQEGCLLILKHAYSGDQPFAANSAFRSDTRACAPLLCLTSSLSRPWVSNT